MLVTGATGLLARHLVPALREQDATVRALVLPGEDASWLETQAAIVHRGDVRDPETLHEPCRNVDTIFHLAAMHGLRHPYQDYHSVNVVGTENVCRAALEAKARRLVHVSTWSVYGSGLGYPVRESQPLRPLDEPYGVTKAAADELVLRFAQRDRLPAVVVRPGTLTGPGDRVNFGRMAERLASGKAIIIGSGHNALPLVYVGDVVRGLLLAAESEKAVGQAYNIGNDRPLTQEECWREIARAIAAPPPRLRVPVFALYALAVVAEKAASVNGYRRQPLLTRLGVTIFGHDNRHSIEKARLELGYSPQVGLREALRLAADWYKDQESPVSASAVALPNQEKPSASLASKPR